MISVCIATYNGEKYISRQLDSILGQLQPNDEVIISDDGSTDLTLQAIQTIGSPKVKVVYNNCQHGYTPNFENALRHAQGDIIFLADQDDLWHPDKVSTCLRYLEHADMVVSDADLIDADGQQLAPSYYALRHPHTTFAGNIWKFGYLGCCMAFRRCVLNEALPFPPDHKKCTHDNWLFLAAKCFHKVTIAPEKLIHYRRHDSNTSRGGVEKSTTLLFKIKYRIYLLWHLLCRCLTKKRIHNISSNRND